MLKILKHFSLKKNIVVFDIWKSISGTIEDYKLLEKMNKVTLCKYSEMKHIATNVGGALQELNEKCK